MTVRDCAQRRRVAYVLAEPIDLDVLGPVIAGEVRIDRFSELVAEAQDHLAFPVGPHSHATGVVGGRTLIVTYGKLVADAAPASQATFEGGLTALYGPIVPMPNLRAAEQVTRLVDDG